MKNLITKSRIENEIRKNYYNDKLTVQRLANKFNVCQSHFREIVHSNFLMSPQQLIEIIRLEEGKRLLLNDLKVYEVANKVGYSNARSFRRAFKKRFVINPSQFRERLKNKYYKDVNIRKQTQKQLLD